MRSDWFGEHGWGQSSVVRVPDGFEWVVDDGCTGLVRRDLAAQPLGDTWCDERQGQPLVGPDGNALSGRGVVRALTVAEGLVAVVRRFRRGGVLRRLLPDLFFGPGRAVAELEVLARLNAQGVPVVEPLAAVAKRRWLVHELRLATVRVTGALPLPAALAQRPELRRAIVRRAGEVVRSAFDHGLQHPDLHPDNLIAVVESGAGAVSTGCPAVLLLDLDSARLVDSLSSDQRDGMLVRMARYLVRHRDRLPIEPSSTDTLRFLRGHGWDRAARRAGLLRLRPRYLAALARRGLVDPHPGSAGRLQGRTL